MAPSSFGFDPERTTYITRRQVYVKHDSTSFSATEERSKQWHPGKMGQKEYDDNRGDDDDDNGNYGRGGDGRDDEWSSQTSRSY